LSWGSSHLADVSAQMVDDLLQTALHLLRVMTWVAVGFARHENVPFEDSGKLAGLASGDVRRQMI
jgi:hypothetical protein